MALGDVLELRPVGSWTAANVATLRGALRRRGSPADRSNAVRLDMSGVHELDTLGAWLLEDVAARKIRRPIMPIWSALPIIMLA